VHAPVALRFQRRAGRSLLPRWLLAWLAIVRRALLIPLSGPSAASWGRSS